MEIKPRYNENRIGLTQIMPVKATKDDLKLYQAVIHKRELDYKYVRLGVDCRLLYAKLLGHKELSALIEKSKDDFVLVLDIKHPSCNRKLFIGGDCTYTFAICELKTIKKVILERVTFWLKKNLAGIMPKETMLSYCKTEKYGMQLDNYGVMRYARRRPASATYFQNMFEERHWANVEFE
jgi:hypothetical protein